MEEQIVRRGGEGGEEAEELIVRLSGGVGGGGEDAEELIVWRAKLGQFKSYRNSFLLLH